MICLNCGKHVDDEVRVCPFCGAPIETGEELSVGAETEEAPLPINLNSWKAGDEEIEEREREEEKKLPLRIRAEGGPSLPTLILSLCSLALGVLCLIALISLRGSILELKNAQMQNLNELNASVQTMNERLDRLDSTLAKVQTEAYEQVASQSISLVKDLTPLTGPVDEGKYNRMFIVTAKGNLNVDTAFDWQRYNEATGGWVSIVFTGDATTNEQYGLRLENQFDSTLNEYTTILWANGITKEAEGSYRCVITDAGGITKTSAQATVTIAPAE